MSLLFKDMMVTVSLLFKDKMVTMTLLFKEQRVTMFLTIQGPNCDNVLTIQGQNGDSVLTIHSLVPSPTLGRWVWLPAYSKLGQHYVSGPTVVVSGYSHRLVM